MKKILLFLFGIILSFALNAQIPGNPDANGIITLGPPWVTGVAQGNGEMGAQLNYIYSYTTDNSTQLKDSLRRFNVLSPPYNADRTGVLDASTAIQAAIDDASEVSGHSYIGGTVIIPQAIYLIDNPMTLKTSVRVLVDGFAILKVDDTPPTHIWDFEDVCKFTWLEGGFYDLGKNYDVNFIQDSALNSGDHKVYMRIQNMVVDNPKTFMDLYSSGGWGWNANIFDNIVVQGYEQFIRTHTTGENYGQTFVGNTISNIQLQGNEYTISALDTLRAASYNQFVNIMCWDLVTADPDAFTVVFDTSAYRNTIIAGAFSVYGWEDLSNDKNIVIGDDMISSRYFYLVPDDQMDTITGGMYFDSDDNHFYGFNGTDWIQLDN